MSRLFIGFRGSLTRRALRARPFTCTACALDAEKEKPQPEEDKNLQSDAFEKTHGQPRNVSSDSEAAVKADNEADGNVEELQKATEQAAKEDHKGKS